MSVFAQNVSSQENVSHLLANQLVTFPEHVTSLRVSEDHPVCPAVFYHGRAGGQGNMLETKHTGC